MNNLILHRVAWKLLQIQHILYIQLIADSLADAGAVRIDDFHDTGTDGSITHNCYIYHIFLPLAAGRLLQICVDKHIDASVQHCRNITAFLTGAVILHQSVWLHDIRTYLVAEADLFYLSPYV